MKYAANSEDIDTQVRSLAFDFLTKKTEIYGEVLPWKILQIGFEFQGQKISLISQQGIFRPKILSMPISIRTAPIIAGIDRPYDDGFGSDGLLRYRYRGDNPKDPDNVALRLTMQHKAPLIYLRGIERGKYRPIWPVFVAHDDPANLTFSVIVDDAKKSFACDGDAAGVEARRQYITSLVQQRLHQQDFRCRVLAAYRSQCAICHLRHEELLDAAHILPDGHPHGAPIVPNGLALCKLHHAAFDQNIVGIRPDFKVEIREDVLKEKDGPMLHHGLQEFNNAPIWTPQKDALRPRPEFIAERYQMFRDFRP